MTGHPVGHQGEVSGTAAAGSLAVPGSPTPSRRVSRLQSLWRCWCHNPWRGRWVAAVWTGLLILPLILLLIEPVGPWRHLAGSVGILGFACAYVWATPLMESGSDAVRPGAAQPDLGSVSDHGWSVLRGPALPRLTLLVAFTGLTLWAAGWLVVYLFPFYCAFLLYLSPPVPLVPGILLVSLGAAALSTVSPIWAPYPYALWIVLGCCLGALSVVLSRLSMEASQRQADAERRLAAANQREEISRDVHDLLGHSLTLLTLKAEVAHRLLAHDPEAAERELLQVIELSRAALADVRATVSRLRVPDLASQVASSRSALAAAGLDVSVSGSPTSVPVPQRELMAWALREATTNILRHARATHVRIELAPGLVRVTDDGQGLQAAPVGNGLSGLRQRVEAARGGLILTSPVPAADATAGRKAAVAAGGRPGTCLEVRL